MVQYRAIVTMADQQKVIHGLSNRAIFNDLEGPQTEICQNMSEMAKDTAIVNSYYGRRIGNRTQALK